MIDYIIHTNKKVEAYELFNSTPRDLRNALKRLRLNREVVTSLTVRTVPTIGRSGI